MNVPGSIDSDPGFLFGGGNTEPYIKIQDNAYYHGKLPDCNFTGCLLIIATMVTAARSQHYIYRRVIHIYDIHMCDGIGNR